MQHFLEIDKNPQAAASIAQTHRAIMKDGSDVVLKIQRPGIREIITTDIEIIKNLILIAEDRKILPEFLKAHKILDEFYESLLKELDFKREIANINKFSVNMNNEDKIITPAVYEELSSRKLLVLEEIKGIKLNSINDHKEINDYGINGEFLAVLGARSLMKQILIDGFFHADPHPGNIFVVGEDNLAYIDFGLMGQLTGEDRDKINTLFLALLQQDVDIITDILLEMGQFDKEVNVRKFKLEIQDLMSRYYGVELADIDFMTVIDDIERLLYNFHIRMPEEFFLLFRAIGVSEGIGFLLDPSFNLVKVARDFVKELMISKLQPEHLIEKTINKLWSLYNITRGLPVKINQLMNNIVNDKFTIRFKHVNLEELIRKLDIVSNRLSLSMIISALIIGSSMIIRTDMEPVIYGIPLLGFLGYSIAGVMGIWLVISIFRSGRF